MSPEFLEREFLDNTIGNILTALAIILIAVVIVKLFRCYFLKRLKRWVNKTPTIWDDRLVAIGERHSIPIFYLLSFYLAVNQLTLHPLLARSIEVIIIILATFLGVKLITSLIEYSLRLYWVTHRPNNVNLEQTIDALLPAIRTVVWAIGLVFLLDNLGFNISAVIASLGIGGVALALASQGLLQDLFSYFAILFDRPFELGDFIIVGDCVGTIEYVGIKTTRLRSLDGEQIVIANSDLTGSRIRNFKRMKQRRIAFKFGVTYDTNPEQLAAIPQIVAEIIDRTENVTFDRAHFLAYGDFSLDYEVVYLVDNSDYTLYMNAQQQINLELKRKFTKQNIEFAYPTQVNYLYI
ncbi:mechanosensitive ion channel family protein [Myxosarcina sp. GI1(2024)]